MRYINRHYLSICLSEPNRVFRTVPNQSHSELNPSVFFSKNRTETEPKF